MKEQEGPWHKTKYCTGDRRDRALYTTLYMRQEGQSIVHNLVQETGGTEHCTRPCTGDRDRTLYTTLYRRQEGQSIAHNLVQETGTEHYTQPCTGDRRDRA